jgi:phenylacetate-CoA ligase
MTSSRPEATRRAWRETLDKYRRDFERPGSEKYWSPSLDTASRDELIAIQNAKLAALAPFLYENSGFYRRRFDKLGLAPTDIKTLDDLPKWPVVDKSEMMQDALAHQPYGTYTAMNDAVWADRGWMMFSSSGSTGVPRVFRYSHYDRLYWEWANARALYSMNIRRGDTAFIISGYGPHVFAWGVQQALTHMGVPTLPGGGMDGKTRANVVLRFQPTALACTPSYALYLGRMLEELGADPAKTSVKTILVGGEPAMGIRATRERLQELWGARLVEFYGCTEASPHCGGYSCPATHGEDGSVSAHLMDDIQIWETVDADTRQPVADGETGLTVCTCLNSESSPQLRFLVGDYTRLERKRCACGRTHTRALGSFVGRADDLLNLRGIKMYPAQIEEGVRSVPGVGDEYEIVLATTPDGLDVMVLRVEHADHAAPGGVAERIVAEVRQRCEIRADVEVLRPGTLPKTEFKAKRVRDTRKKS